ncbi:MAG: response regulator [Spirochaetales bacterium]|nr:response regulator [Spirochaetales bacterium]
MKKEDILIVEDDEDIRELISFNLKNEGYRVIGVSSGEKALISIGEKKPALILLDLMLPGIDGLTMCEQLKKETVAGSIPIIIVTARGEEDDIVRGLEAGADDYITKPFSIQVLCARVKAVLRRKKRSDAAEDDSEIPVSIHDLTIDPKRHKSTVKGNPVELTLTEFRILHHLARHPGWVYTRYQLVEAVRGYDYNVTDRSVDVLIFGLRKKLGTCGDYIETVRGIGYRFRE